LMIHLPKDPAELKKLAEALGNDEMVRAGLGV
jgi:hypothetical protein